MNWSENELNRCFMVSKLNGTITNICTTEYDTNDKRKIPPKRLLLFVFFFCLTLHLCHYYCLIDCLNLNKISQI